MAINLPTDPIPIPAVEPAQPAPHARPVAKTVQARTTTQVSAEPAPQQQIVHDPVETNVIFRRDANGQIYYVFTDSQSGRELQEIPTKEVRNVGQGIAELIKELQQKNSNHLEVKG